MSKQIIVSAFIAICLAIPGCMPESYKTKYNSQSQNTKYQLYDKSKLNSSLLINKTLLERLPQLDSTRVGNDIISQRPAQMLCGNIPMPALLKELNQDDIFSSNVSIATNASLSAYGFSGSMGRKDILISSYLVKFKDFPCGNGTKKRALVGIRLYVHASDLKVKVSSPTLPSIAAAAELGLAKSEYRIRVFGLKPSDLYVSLPSAEFNIDTYSKVIASYDKIVHSLNDSTQIDPIVEDIP